MGKLKERQMITPQATILGWRKLHPEMLVFSGQYVDLASGRTQYRSYMKFSWIVHYHCLTGHWQEHYLGIYNEKFVTMFFAQMSELKDKLI